MNIFLYYCEDSGYNRRTTTQQRSPVAEYSVHDMCTKLGKKNDLEDTSTDTMCKIYRRRHNTRYELYIKLYTSDKVNQQVALISKIRRVLILLSLSKSLLKATAIRVGR